MKEYDLLDKKIIDILKEDSRLSFSTIGEKLAVSQPLVNRRIKRMIESGIIKKFTLELDQRKIGNKTHYLLVHCQSEPVRKKMFEIAAQYDIPDFIETELGEYNFMIKINAKYEDVEKFIDELKQIAKAESSRLLVTRIPPELKI